MTHKEEKLRDGMVIILLLSFIIGAICFITSLIVVLTSKNSEIVMWLLVVGSSVPTIAFIVVNIIITILNIR